jgi:hypothetical protein
MWTKLNAFLTDQRFQASFAGFVLTIVAQVLSLFSHKLGLDPETAAKLPGIANALSGAIVLFTLGFVGAHAHAEHGENVGSALAAGLNAAAPALEASVGLAPTPGGGTVAVAAVTTTAPALPAPTDAAQPPKSPGL